MNIDIVALLLRLLHVLPAIFLAGGVFFMWCALVPALSGMADDTRKTVLEAVRGKWAKVVMTTSGLLLLTGLYNFVMNAKGFEYEGGPLYHILGSIKLLLALGVMFITARLSGRSKSAEKFRENIGYWMTVTTGLLFVLILLASTMRTLGKTPKVPTEPAPTTVDASFAAPAPRQLTQ